MHPIRFASRGKNEHLVGLSLMDPDTAIPASSSGRHMGPFSMNNENNEGARMPPATPSREAFTHDAEHDRENPIDVAAGRPAQEPKDRACLACGSTFASEWAGERICRRCKSSHTWRGNTGL